MRAVVQRVSRGSVSVAGETVGTIRQGLVLLIGISRDDDEDDVNYLAEKIANMRIFEDGEGKMNLSVLEIRGEILAVSQFTLFADCRKGRRPSFAQAAPAQAAERLYQRFVEVLQGYGLAVSTGRFQTMMQVEILNDGPVTILLDSKKSF